LLAKPLVISANAVGGTPSVDFSISRSAGREGGWGVPFPGEPDQVVYVWVDALVNYLTGLAYPEGEDITRFWSSESQRVHVIGKNV
jgi:methionyl-tRNA synthetase